VALLVRNDAQSALKFFSLRERSASLIRIALDVMATS
jgi:hypothetical protein